MERRDESDENERQPLLNNNNNNNQNIVNESTTISDSFERKKTAFIAIFAVLFVAAVTMVVVLTSNDTIQSTASNRSTFKTTADISNDIRAAMDTDTSPCDDFYQYACGKWIENTQIPADRNAWGKSFSLVQETNDIELRKLLEDNGKTLHGMFYQSCLNESHINERGITPIKSIFDLIETQLHEKGPLHTCGLLVREGISSLLSIGVQVNVKKPKEHMLALSQPSLGLPDRDYYFDDSMAEKRKQYVQHVSKMLELSGISSDNSSSLAQSIFDFEKQLAFVSLKRDEMRDPEKLYNPTSISDLQPKADWFNFISLALGNDAEIEQTMIVNVEEPLFFAALFSILNQTSNDTFKAYFRFRAIHSYASVLNDKVVLENFNFYSHILYGQDQQLPRWKRCISMTDDLLGDAIGKAYSQSFFPSDSKELAHKLVESVELAFKEQLGKLDWMDNETRLMSEEKLSKLGNLIGYPNQWIDYSSVRKDLTSNYFENVQVMRKFEISREFKKLGKSVDAEEWDMSAPTVNAYYDPSKNIMVFPAGILQYPFFDKKSPAALNFGSIGSVMGHELTHAFDDEGRKYDGQGRLVDWWTSESAKKFELRAQCIETQFNEFPVPGATDSSHLNGKLTLGENIADLGGVKSAYNAFQNYKKSRDQSQLSVDYPQSFRFLTEDQLFFLSFAQTWCEKIRPEYSQLSAKIDPHSPPQYRVQAPLSNLEEFRIAFQCPNTTVYYKKDKCEIW